MPRHRPHPRNLLCRIDVTAFVGIMFVLMFIMLMQAIFRTYVHHGVGPDPPRIAQWVPMPGAMRDDAMLVAIQRTGDIYFGSDRISPEQLPFLVREQVKGGSERKVYIRADARAKYKAISEVVDGVQMAGIQNIAFLVEEPLTSGSPRLAKTP